MPLLEHSSFHVMLRDMAFEECIGNIFNIGVGVGVCLILLPHIN